MQAIVNECCAKRGAEGELEIRIGYPSVYNNPELTERVMSNAVEYLGKDKVHLLPERMTAEDFSTRFRNARVFLPTWNSIP